MDIVIAFLAGAAVTTVVWFVIARNNKRHVTDILNLDPALAWKQIYNKLREKL